MRRILGKALTWARKEKKKRKMESLKPATCVKTFRHSFVHAPFPSPAFPCPYSLERGETSDGREKERGRAETNDATIRHTREKELSALEAAPKSLLGLETESRVGDAT